MALMSKYGATITAVTGIGHQTYKGVADWFFIVNERWPSGKEDAGKQLPPYALCGDDDDMDEIRRLNARLTTYLQSAGKWHDMKHKRDGRAYSWTPKLPTGREEL